MQPAAVQAYLKAKLASDAEGQLATFRPHAVVLDDGNRYEGIDAIKNWTNRTQSEYTITYRVGESTTTGNRTVVAVEIDGNFPGSPVDLRFDFTLDGDRIAALTIAP
jgi:hypothetical protein